MATEITKLDEDLDLEDFDSEDLPELVEADDDFIGGMWSGAGFRSSADINLMQDTIAAQKMVESFVNAFARDGRYTVRFAQVSGGSAGTDLNERRVVITPAPLADPTLDRDQVARVLTGLAVHEISHERYGKRTAQAVAKAFPGNRVADRLSNLLDDVRIERRFAGDYPGYAGVFEPLRQYTGAASVKRNGGLLPSSMKELPNLAIRAVRFPEFTAWDATTEGERSWWQAWADKAAREDSPKRHVDSIREALAHIVDETAKAKAEKKDEPKPTEDEKEDRDETDQKGPEGTGAGLDGSADDDAEENADDAADGDGESDESDDAPQDTESDDSEADNANDAGDSDDAQDSTEDAQDGADDDAQDSDGDPDADGEAEASEAGDADNASEADGGSPSDGMTDYELNLETRHAADAESSHDASCDGTGAVVEAALENGASGHEIQDLTRTADAAIEIAANQEGDGNGHTVDVAKSLRGLTRGYEKLGPSSVASRHIRSAILRSRTGTTDVTPFRRHGRLDQRGLDRIARGDARVFEQRRSPSPGKYLVWVMVDASGSMDGYPLMQAAQVSHAMATASHGTPSVRMTVWAWSSPFRPTSYANAGVAKVWESGGDAEQIWRMAGLETGGTPDGITLAWAARAIRREARRDEQPVIIVVSDGMGDPNMDDRIAEARRAGVDVYGVSFGSMLSESVLESRYGRGNIVPFAGTIVATAKPLGDLFARIASRPAGEGSRQR